MTETDGYFENFVVEKINIEDSHETIFDYTGTESSCNLVASDRSVARAFGEGAFCCP